MDLHGSSQTMDLFQGHVCISDSFFPSIWQATSFYGSIETDDGLKDMFQGIYKRNRKLYQKI